MKTSLGFVLGCLSIGAYVSLGACSSNGGGGHGASSGGSSPFGSSGSSSSSGSSGGGSSSGGSSGVGSSSGGSSGGRSGSSSGSSSASSSGSSSGGGSTPYIGEIGVIMGSAGGSSFWNGAAGFSATPDAGGGSTCKGTQSGKCCYTPPGGSSTGNTLTYVSAGDIVVKDGSTTIATMSPTTQGGIMNAYVANSQLNSAFQWAGGDTLSFTAAGGTVNAFSGSVVAPGLMQNINPALSTSTPTMVSAGSDFTVTWTPGATSGVPASIFVGATKMNTQDGSIFCNGMDSDGSITVPQALLANIASGDGLQIVLSRLVSSTVMMGNVSVIIGVSAETLGDGQLK